MANHIEKDAFYFPHFSNARIDRKIKRIRMKYKLEGYGAFFCTLEVLRDQSNFSYPFEDLDILADDFGCDIELLRSVICDFDLFAFDKNGNFFSKNLIEYLTPFLKGREQKIFGGIKGNLMRYGHATKEEINKMNKEDILKLAESSGYDINSIFSLKSRLPIANRLVTDRIGSQTNEMKLNETNQTNEIKQMKVKVVTSHSETNEKTTYQCESGITVPITASIHDRLVDKHNIKTIELYYDKITAYCESKNKSYKDYSLTAKNWIDKDIANGQFSLIVERPEHRIIGYKICPKCGTSVIDHLSYCNGENESGEKCDYLFYDTDPITGESIYPADSPDNPKNKQHY